jgi:hypothetical protein
VKFYVIHMYPDLHIGEESDILASPGVWDRICPMALRMVLPIHRTQGIPALLVSYVHTYIHIGGKAPDSYITKSNYVHT